MADVTLHIVEQGVANRSFKVEDGCTVLVGRANECNLKMTNMQISRFHCLLERRGEKVLIRDFGSKHGTFINEKLIGQRPAGMSAEEGKAQQYENQTLNNGDILQLGKVCKITVEIKQDKKEAVKCLMCGRAVAGSGSLCSACLGKIAQEFDIQPKQPEKKPEKKPEPAKQTPKMQKGDIIPGYEKLGAIGEGGMGTVYKVRERSTGKIMALKTVRKQLAAEKASLKMFVREASLAQQLDNDHIAKQYATGEYDGMPYILMAYYPTGNLRTYWNSLDWRKYDKYRFGMSFLMQILAGLDYLHNAKLTVELEDGTKKTVHGIGHRDLKPDNIFVEIVNGSPVLKIADFGLSKAFEVAGMTGHTMTGAAMGTLVYMPRQQIMNFKYSKPDVDVWAAVASVYHLMTNQFAKPFENGIEPMKVVLMKDAVPINQRDPKVPKVFAKIIDKALADKTTLYYESAKKLHLDAHAAYTQYYK